MERDGYFKNKSIADHVQTNAAISLREMSLVRCMLCCRSRSIISNYVDKAVLGIGHVFLQPHAVCKDSSRRSKTATLATG
jgi:hypothetical protein